MYKPNQNFKLSQATKRMMANLDKGSPRNTYKRDMVQAQLAEQLNKMRKKKDDTPTEGDN
jgi:hypothetical protein